MTYEHYYTIRLMVLGRYNGSGHGPFVLLYRISHLGQFCRQEGGINKMITKIITGCVALIIIPMSIAAFILWWAIVYRFLRDIKANREEEKQIEKHISGSEYSHLYKLTDLISGIIKQNKELKKELSELKSEKNNYA